MTDDDDGRGNVFPFDPRKNARTTDPDTSKAAAYRLRANAQRWQLLRAFHMCGPMTMDEAAAYTGLPRWGVGKRVSELRGYELLDDTGQRRPGASGRAQIVSRITAAGVAVLQGRAS